jgi:hypothetical protein
VADAEVTNELASLEATRSRLEAGLSDDENWRALRQAGARGTDDEGAARRVRDARLELALLSNPLYRAWKHVNDAIEDLRRNGAHSERPSGSNMPAAGPEVAGGSSIIEPWSLANLSRGIARLIQGGAGESQREPVRADAEEGQEHDSSPAPRDREPLPGAPDVSEEAEMAVRPSPSPVRSAEPTAAAADAEAAAEPPETAESSSRPTEPEKTGPTFRQVVGEEEATVIFVTREPVTAPPPSPNMPTDADVDRKPALSDRLRSLEEQAAPAGDASEPLYPLDGQIEEAEVTILTSENAKSNRQAEQRVGNLRRFRKALLGD